MALRQGTALGRKLSFPFLTLSPSFLLLAITLHLKFRDRESRQVVREKGFVSRVGGIGPCVPGEPHSALVGERWDWVRFT